MSDTETHSWMNATLQELKSRSTISSELQLQVRLMPWQAGALTGMKVDGITLHAPIGRGGFGTIYAGTSPDGTRVAVKVLEASSITHRHHARFRQEFDRLQKLDPHPGIIRCFATSVAPINGRVYPWYSMEFAISGDLGNRERILSLFGIRKESSLTWSTRSASGFCLRSECGKNPV